jgi:hypothetical protein
MAQKCTEDVSGKVPFEMKAAYDRICHEHGTNMSEMVRDHVCMVVHSMTYGEFVANDRRALLDKQAKLQPLVRAYE